MLHAVPFLYSVIERSPTLFKTRGGQQFTASYDNLQGSMLDICTWKYSMNNMITTGIDSPVITKKGIGNSADDASLSSISKGFSGYY